MTMKAGTGKSNGKALDLHAYLVSCETLLLGCQVCILGSIVMVEKLFLDWEHLALHAKFGSLFWD